VSLSLAVQVSGLPGTYTYRLFGLLKSGADFVSLRRQLMERTIRSRFHLVNTFFYKNRHISSKRHITT
ncbi:hypothetical protein ACFOLG_06540, partial [Vogesella facilis]